MTVFLVCMHHDFYLLLQQWMAMYKQLREIKFAASQNWKCLSCFAKHTDFPHSVRNWGILM